MNRSRIRVLHIDDDPGILDLTDEFLKREDSRFALETATSADDGLDQIAEQPPDCIVSDYDMPGKNGIEFLRAVRKAHPELPFILFTGKGSESVASDAMAAGVTDYLQKGSETEQYELLANRIVNAVQSRRAAQEVERQQDLISRAEILGSMGGWELHLDTEELRMTGGLKNLYGLDKNSELSLAETIDLYNEKSQERIERVIKTAAESGYAECTELYFQRVDGEQRVAEGNAELVDNGGDGTVLRGVVRDITEQHHRQQELRLLQQAIDDANVAITLADPSAHDNPLTYVNSAYEELTGYGEEEALGRNCRYLQGENTDPDTVSALREAIDDEAPITVELRNYRKNGTEFWNRLTITPIYNDGELVRYLGTQEDVTERKEREQRLARTEALMSKMEQLADVGAWEYDPKIGVPTNTAGTKQIYGVAPSADLTLDEAFEFFHPADRDRLRDRFKTCLEAGESYEIDVRVVTADGERRWVTAHGERVETRDGGPVVRGYIQDITARKQRLTRLEQIETLFQNAQDMLFVIEQTDRGFVIRRVNDAFERATGLLNKRLQGQTPQEVFGTERGRQIEQRYRRCLKAGEPLSYEEVVKARKMPDAEAPDDSEDTYWETRIAPVETGDDEQWIVGATRDINERKCRERELERQNERLEEFASVVSHDLRNPLQIAEGRLELARAECESVHLDKIADALARGQTLVEDLLTLARGGRTIGDLETVSVSSLAQDCWEVIPGEEATLAVETDRTVLADRSRLQQLLENLFANAIKHGGESVMIRVGDLADGFYVADDGVGIPEGEREDIFEAGYSTTADGTGFGLRITRQVVDAHGWEIRVTDSDDGGARFEITGVESHN
jgi:PAS domain S-box-containing protein